MDICLPSILHVLAWYDVKYAAALYTTQVENHLLYDYNLYSPYNYVMRYKP